MTAKRHARESSGQEVGHGQYFVSVPLTIDFISKDVQVCTYIYSMYVITNMSTIIIMYTSNLLNVKLQIFFLKYFVELQGVSKVMVNNLQMESTN